MATARNREHRHDHSGRRPGRHRDRNRHRDRHRGRRRGRRATAARRALRREAPSTVAVVADPAGFAVMRRHTTFLFEDHHAYLRQTEALLRSLTARGIHTRVGLFDPDDYARFCAQERIDPDSPGNRTRYVAEIAATGVTVRYRGQPLARLLPLLLGGWEHQETWERATGLLTDLGSGRDGTERKALDAAAGITAGLLAAAGPGTHHLVCSVTGVAGPLIAVLHADGTPHAPPRTDTTQALVFRTVLAVGLAAGRPGGVVMRTTRAGREEVRGWNLVDGRIRPLTEAEVFSAYCTDAATGEPVPPEPGLTYSAGFPLPSAPGFPDTPGPGEPEGHEGR